MSFNDLVFSVVMITAYFGGMIGSATGFFYGTRERIVLCTNMHVIFEPTCSRFADSIFVTVHLKGDDLTRNRRIKIPLEKNGRPQWHAHPKLASDVDIVQIDLNESSLSGSHVERLNQPMSNLGDEQIPLGDAVTLIGFPLGYSDTLNNLPLLKSGIISTPFGVYHNGHPYFLLDANVWHGMSGSPVFTQQTGAKYIPGREPVTTIGRFPPKFIGIFGQVARGRNGALITDAAVVWYAALVEEIYRALPAEN